jgi:hypothetical protein
MMSAGRFRSFISVGIVRRIVTVIDLLCQWMAMCGGVRSAQRVGCLLFKISVWVRTQTINLKTEIDTYQYNEVLPPEEGNRDSSRKVFHNRCAPHIGHC